MRLIFSIMVSRPCNISLCPGKHLIKHQLNINREYIVATILTLQTHV